MTRWRHLVLVTLAALPLLVIGLVMVAGEDLSPVWTVVLWVLGVLVVDTVVWRTGLGPVQDTLGELDASTPDEARWRVRELKQRSELCQADRSRMSELVTDLLSSLGEGLVVVDQELKIRLINPVALRFSGVDSVRPETHLLELLRDPGIVEVFESAAQGGEPRPVVVENPRGMWEVRAFPVRDGGAVGLLSDVSLIRRASEFRRRFVQDLSHELRSPLTVMRTMVEALEGEVTPELADMLVRQVDRVNRLATELNELASIEAGHVELDLGAVSVHEVVGEVVGDFRHESVRAGVTVEIDVADDLHCWCDRRGLYRVLSNLVDNAIKYNRRGGWVRVKGSHAGDRVTLQVADSGQGIPADELQAVFQRFYRIDRARTPGEGGLGLGLAIVKHMVQHMGGKLSLDSREGVGTRVTVELPARDPGSGSLL